MSFSPESFDRLLADKLAQAPAPAYEPAHWDQLEDQLQHLNHAFQQAAQPAPVPSAPAAAPLAGSMAKMGFAALLTGLTAVNGYFFYVTNTNPQPAPAAVVAPAGTPVATSVAPAPVTAAVVPPVAAATTPAAAPVATAPVGRPVPVPNRLARPLVAVAPLAAKTTLAGTALAPPLPAATRAAAPVLAVPVPAATATVAPAAPDSSAAEKFATTPATRPALPDLPNIITPDGDGRNDRFELPSVIGPCRLTVFDRANRVVFSAERYDNSWDGGTLPAGQYLYLIETTGPATWRTPGALTIKR